MSAKFSKANQIIRTLRALGHEALLAGGCVRDKLMGREPQDYDIATSALPHRVNEAFPRVEAVGEAYGVMLVIIDEESFEVATFRADGPYEDGRHPKSVEFCSSVEDAKRRDFTVNAMFYDPGEDRVDDLVDGQKDLKAKIIRCVGDPALRFAEDKLRILRAVRFAVQLDFEIEEKTWEQVKAFASEITQVAWERIEKEMTKILLSSQPRRGIELLDESGLLKELIPEMEKLKGCEQPTRFHPEGDCWVHTLLALEKMQRPSEELAWGVLLHDIGKPNTFSHEEGDRIRFNRHETAGAGIARIICQRFRMSNERTEAVSTLVMDHMRLSHIREMREAKQKRLMRRDDFENLLELHRLDCAASHADFTIFDFVTAKLKEFEAQETEDALKPPPLVTGYDLIAMGLKPGPCFKKILDAVEDEQLEGHIKDRENALAYIREKHQEG